jgi:hypothetical protein
LATAMPRFCLDITENGLSATEEDGVLLPNLDEAQHETAWALAEIAAQHSESGARESLQVVIADEAHTPLARISLIFECERLSSTRALRKRN